MCLCFIKVLIGIYHINLAAYVLSLTQLIKSISVSCDNYSPLFVLLKDVLVLSKSSKL